MEQKLSEAKPGDLFIWLSPPPFEQSNKESASNGFGKHSFVFVFRLEQDLQKEWVECVALRVYLDRKGLGEFFYQMTGEAVSSFDSEHLLAQLGKVKNHKIWSVLDIQRAIKEIYDNTPASRKIVPEDDFFVEEEKADAVLENFLPWIKGIYFLLKFKAPDWLVEREFHRLEREVWKALRGEEFNLPFIEGIRPAQWASSLMEFALVPTTSIVPSPELFSIIFGGSCGMGSGFGLGRQSPPLVVNYQTAESSFTKESKEYIVCPVCGLKVKKGIGVCPYCHIKLSSS